MSLGVLLISVHSVGSVFDVDFDRAIHGGKSAPDLVVLSRVQVDFQEVVPLEDG